MQFRKLAVVLLITAMVVTVSAVDYPGSLGGPWFVGNRIWNQNGDPTGGLDGDYAIDISDGGLWNRTGGAWVQIATLMTDSVVNTWILTNRSEILAAVDQNITATNLTIMNMIAGNLTANGATNTSVINMIHGNLTAQMVANRSEILAAVDRNITATNITIMNMIAGNLTAINQTIINMVHGNLTAQMTTNRSEILAAVDRNITATNLTIMNMIAGNLTANGATNTSVINMIHGNLTTQIKNNRSEILMAVDQNITAMNLTIINMIHGNLTTQIKNNRSEILAAVDRNVTATNLTIINMIAGNLTAINQTIINMVHGNLTQQMMTNRSEILAAVDRNVTATNLTIINMIHGNLTTQIKNNRSEILAADALNLTSAKNARTNLTIQASSFTADSANGANEYAPNSSLGNSYPEIVVIGFPAGYSAVGKNATSSFRLPGDFNSASPYLNITYIWTASSGAAAETVLWTAEVACAVDNTARPVWGANTSISDAYLGPNIVHTATAPPLLPGGTVQAGSECWLHVRCPGGTLTGERYLIAAGVSHASV